MPSLPAYVLLLASIPLLVPTVGPALAQRLPPRVPSIRRTRIALPLAAVLLALLPLPNQLREAFRAIGRAEQPGRTDVQRHEPSGFVRTNVLRVAVATMSPC